MAWLIWRELVVATRVPAIWVAAAFYVSLLASFLLIWGDGVPLMAGTPLDHFIRIQWFSTALLSPWIVCRVAASRDELSLLAALGAQEASRVVIARVIAATVVIQSITVTSLPLAVIAAAIADVAFMRLAALFGSLALLNAIAATVATAATLLVTDRLAAWVIAALTVGLGLAIAGDSLAALLSCGVAASVLLAAAAAHANRASRHANPGSDGAL